MLISNCAPFTDVTKYFSKEEQFSEGGKKDAYLRL